MKLYYSPGACSLSPHIVFREAGLDVALERVNLAEKRTETGTDYKAINPKGYVPALQLDNGELLTEGPAIVQYLADQKPAANLAPANGTMARYRLQEWLTYIGTEIHKTFSPLFNPNTPDATKQANRDKLAVRFALPNEVLSKHPYLMGESFTVADAYLFTVLRWTKSLKVDLTPFPALVSYMERVGARPAVRAALDFERQK